MTQALLVGFALIVAVFGPLSGHASAASFNNVQVFVNTSRQLPYSYTFTAYNTTGSLVGTYQGPFPAGAFELPNGDYLFTVSAVYQNFTACYLCPYAVDGTPQPTKNTTTGPSLMPVYYRPDSEYGYLTAHIDSSQSFTIDTKNITAFPTEQVTVKVTFVNGTAAAAASVSASVVGQWYYWWGQDSNAVMWAQTGSDGIAHLVLPAAPAVVTAWEWVPINLPPDQKTVSVDVGGQDVNVTVYWQPSYVGLSASSLLIPPADTLNLTLHYQPQIFWAMPAGAMTAPAVIGGAPDATLANQPTGTPAGVRQAPGSATGGNQYYLPGQVPALNLQGTTSQSSLAGDGFLLAAAGVGVVALAALAVAGVALRRKRSVVEARK